MSTRKSPTSGTMPAPGDVLRGMGRVPGVVVSLNLAATSLSCSNREILAPAVRAPLRFHDARRQHPGHAPY